MKNRVPARTPEERAEIARRNGAKSVGPVTPEGKQRSSRNAVTHGIYTRNVVLENESQDLYLNMREKYLAELAPVGERETNLVLDIVNARWRKSRLVLMETAAIDCAMTRQRAIIDEEFDTIDEAIRTSLAFIGYDGEPYAGFALIGRTEGRLHRQIIRDTRELERLQAKRLRAGAGTGTPSPASAAPDDGPRA